MDRSGLQVYILSGRAGFLPAEIDGTLKTRFCYFKPVWSFSSSHIDDSYLQGNDFADCVTDVIGIISLFESLGFVIRPLKSVLVRSDILRETSTLVLFLI